MSIETNIFKRFTPNFKKLVKFGFKKLESDFIFDIKFFNNQFQANIVISKNGEVKGTVFDIENNDEFLPLRVENTQGGFTEEVKSKYEELLINIRENCFDKNYFISSQSNRIAAEIIKKYNTEPEFLWANLPTYGVFRNNKTNKWFALFGEVDKNKLQNKAKGKVEILNIKLCPENIQNLLIQPHFYPAYHMNKKSWITIIMDESVNDEKILTLVDESFELNSPKNKPQIK